jgi:nucleoside 2-deoxyribosyltransferase
VKVYLIGSLRNPAIPALGNELRSAGFRVFDDWHAAGPRADDEWQRYEQERERTYLEALKGESSRQVFEFDKRHLDSADAAVMVMPAGKSAHLELGYMARVKPTFVLFDKEPERWDVMYRFATGVTYDRHELIGWLEKIRRELRLEAA